MSRWRYQVEEGGHRLKTRREGEDYKRGREVKREVEEKLVAQMGLAVAPSNDGGRGGGREETWKTWKKRRRGVEEEE
jgi:hypothetical protein